MDMDKENSLSCNKQLTTKSTDGQIIQEKQ